MLLEASRTWRENGKIQNSKFEFRREWMEYSLAYSLCFRIFFGIFLMLLENSLAYSLCSGIFFGILHMV
jgi:hypothetical protein